MTKRPSLSRFTRRGLAMLAYVILVLAPMPSGGAVPAAAAELDGVPMPDTWAAGGTTLRLNGIGLRTYSLFRIHVYVAGLYLQQPTSDAEAILRSEAVKLLDIHFLHDVTAARAREAWRTGFRSNCQLPCRLADSMIERFLAAVPDFHRGDESTLLFTPKAVEITVNGRVLGVVNDAQFSRAMLSNFIGAHPPTETFKHALLGQSG